MLWYPDEQLVIITPPHTASGNISKALPRQHGCILVMGPGPDKNIDHHFASLSSSFAPKTRVACVWRDPAERLVGLWDHYNWYSEFSGWRKRSIDEFVSWICSNDEVLSWFYRWTIRRLLKHGRTKVDKWIMFNSLSEDIELFTGKKFIIPDRNTRYKNASDYITEDHRKKLSQWLKADTTLLE